MNEYAAYRGYYIGPGTFQNRAEIDNFLKEKAINAYKQAIRYFINHPGMESSRHADEKAEHLHRVHGFTWEQIEAIEIETLTA